MGFLRSGGTPGTQVTVYSGLQVQTQSGALPIPIVWGRSLLTPNCLWYNNFTATKGKGSKGGVGKGGGGGSSQAVSYTYSASVLLGLCEGPIAGINRIWSESAFVTLSNLNLSLFSGSISQTMWSYYDSGASNAALDAAWATLNAGLPVTMTTNPAAQGLNYPGVAYVASTSFNLGANAVIGNNIFEIMGFLSGTAGNGSDADPAFVIQDFLTNPQYGVQFPTSSIDLTTLLGTTGATYQAYTQSLSIGISPVLMNQESAGSILSRWLQLTNSSAVWSSGKLRFIPYGDSAVGTYTPNRTPIYDLSDEDYVQTDGEDPVVVIRSDPYTTPNVQRVEILDRDNSYASVSVEARDQSAIELYGLRIGSTVTAHELCNKSIAQLTAQLILQKILYTRNTFRFKLSWEFCLLDPMDIVTITDAYLGISRLPVRIIGIEEDDQGLLSVTAEEISTGSASASAFPSFSVTSAAPNSHVAPAAVNTPIFFEPPPIMTNNLSQLWIGVSPVGGDPNWGGCSIWASLDNVSFVSIGSVTAPAVQGSITATLGTPPGVNPDMTDTLSVDLTMSKGALSSSSTIGAAAGASMCLVGDELVSFVTATMTGANRYDLTDLYRGFFSTETAPKFTGAQFLFLDSSVFRYTVPGSQIGQTVFLKFQSFNIFGQSLQDLSTCVSYPYSVLRTGTIGPVATSLAAGTAMDFGLASQLVAEADDYGTLSGQVTNIIDLGNCTS